MSIGKAWTRFAEATGLGVLLVVVIAMTSTWLGWRRLLSMAERNFWALNALAVQPGYLLWRETMRHLIERVVKNRTGAALTRVRAASCLAAGLALTAVAGLVAYVVWPATQWVGSVSDLMLPHKLVQHTLANAIVIMSASLSVGALVWAVADATGDALLDLTSFDEAEPNAAVWRVAHLSDLHVVGERYGFRIESGRAGPRGNDGLIRALDELAAQHETNPLDLIIVSGDMTDAGSSAEWAAFLDIFADYPELTARMLLVPGNHDTNIVDRSNPARLNLPFSPIKSLRKMRALSAIAAIQGGRVHAVASTGAALGPTLSDVLEPHRDEITDFANDGGVRRSARLAELWDGLYPMIMPPTTADGLGVALLDSDANTNFSFTNALGSRVERADAASHRRLRHLSARSLDRGAASPCDRISDAGRSAIGADRNCSDQRGLVPSCAQALCSPHRRPSRPPSHRLVRNLRGAQDRFGALACDGAPGEGNALLRAHAIGRAERVDPPACAAPYRHRARNARRRLKKFDYRATHKVTQADCNRSN